MSHHIYLFNTLTRTKEVLRTEQADRVTMYVCGPTVYNYAHIGNARPAIVFDVLFRLLRHDYSQVIYTRNFTDVDDKINASAAGSGVPISTITSRYIKAYQEDMQTLNVLSPNFEPCVTEHIPAIIELIQALIARGHAYIEQSHVLFHVPSYSQYGQLSGRKIEDMIAGARVEVAPYKRDPLDFVLWKPSMPELPGWDSPWGRGRPGWHIECSAMIDKHFGHTIDIHGGGQDLIFPHHENEIAQGTCAHDGNLYCRTWVHNSFVTVDGQKMSKSLGNIHLVRDLLKQAPGEVIRLALLATHYRKPLDWNAQRLVQSRQMLLRWYTALAKMQMDDVTWQTSEPDAQVLIGLRDDLNISLVLSRLHVLCTDLEQATSIKDKQQAAILLRASGALLGLLQQPVQLILRHLHGGNYHALQKERLSVSCIEALLKQRDSARQQRDFALADSLRSELLKAGIVLYDTPQGTRWEFTDEVIM